MKLAGFVGMTMSYMGYLTIFGVDKFCYGAQSF